MTEEWTRLLTEEEREAEIRHFESMAGRICNLCMEGWPCTTKAVFRSLAASRALVAEKDKALRDLVYYMSDLASPKPELGVWDIARQAHIALALKEKEKASE